MYEHNALGYWSGLALCLTKVRSSRAGCPATALIHTLSHSSFSEKLASLQKTPQGSPPSSNEEFFFTPPASMVEMSPAAGAGTGAGGQVIDRRPPANVNFNEAIEQIQMRKAQEQMSIDGHEYVMLLKVSLSYFTWRLVFGFLTKSNRNRAVLPHLMASGIRIGI